MEVAEAPEVQEAPSVPNTIDNRARKFVAVAHDSKFYVFNPEGVRISGPLAELEAVELAQRFQAFRR